MEIIKYSLVNRKEKGLKDVFESDNEDGERRKMFHQQYETSMEGAVREEKRGKRRREKRMLGHNYK